MAGGGYREFLGQKRNPDLAEIQQNEIQSSETELVAKHGLALLHAAVNEEHYIAYTYICAYISVANSAERGRVSTATYGLPFCP